MKQEDWTRVILGNGISHRALENFHTLKLAN